MHKKSPYCNEKLEEGYINHNGMNFKWYKNEMNVIEKCTRFGGECLFENNCLGKIKAYRCRKYEKIILDIKGIKESKEN